MLLILGSKCASIVHVQWTVDMLRMKTGRSGILPGLAHRLLCKTGTGEN